MILNFDILRLQYILDPGKHVHLWVINRQVKDAGNHHYFNYSCNGIERKQTSWRYSNSIQSAMLVIF